MASSVLAIPPSLYHKPTPAIRTSKLATTDVRSEDELLKFFLHGSYDVQRGNTRHGQLEENTEKAVCIKDETTSHSDEKTGKNRCMFEETFMINISVKQPNMTPTSKQIDVRIQKTPSDTHSPREKIVDEDDDEISSIFDEDENDEVDSVIFNEINTPTSDASPTKLTLADMINKTLTTMPTLPPDVKTNSRPAEIKARKKSEDLIAEKVVRTPPPSAPVPTKVQPPTLTTDINEDTKLFQYLDYLETKEESNQPTAKRSPKPTPSVTKVPVKQPEHDVLPIIDLEQLCRSLTVNDLKDELIRKKIYELKLLIDEQHRKPKTQTTSTRPKKDNLPVLIAMPPLLQQQQQRRRTAIVQPTNTLLQSKTVNLQIPYHSNYQGLVFNYPNAHSPPSSSNNQQQSRRAMPSVNTNYKYQHT